MARRLLKGPSEMTTTTTTSRCRMALYMAVYTLLLAIGAALPLAASYSDAIQGRTSEGHIQGGAFQRREATDATTEDQAQPEAPRGRRAELSADGLCAEVEPCDALDVTVGPVSIDTRGS
ncbi:MAG: hypothetical protein KC619_12150 [Myxococcales bacterium]|nr:hypothetical protein [Myxococcales bacterium]